MKNTNTSTDEAAGPSAPHLGAVHLLDLSGGRCSPRGRTRLVEAHGQSRVSRSGGLKRRLVVHVLAAVVPCYRGAAVLSDRVSESKDRRRRGVIEYLMPEN